jgi:hypothetical protein
MNDQQLETLTYERQKTFLAEAEERRLVQHAVVNQGHPIRVWIGQRLIALGQRWSSGSGPSALRVSAESVAR